MRYSILGFSQEAVCKITKVVVDENGKEKQFCLDVTDLLLLRELADFMNRNSIIKYAIDGKMYFSITHNAILKDLPILSIKQQALKDRIDKICLLGLVEKTVIRNEMGTWVGYRLTDLYESLVYGNSETNAGGGVYQTTRGGCSELHEGGVAKYTPNIDNTINVNNTINVEEKEIDKSISKKTSAKSDILTEYDLSSVPSEYVDVIREWCEYKRARREKYKTQGSFESMVKRLVKLSGGNPQKAKAIVEQSIGNNYAGLFELKQYNGGNNMPIGFKLEGDVLEKMKKQPKQVW